MNHSRGEIEGVVFWGIPLLIRSLRPMVGARMCRTGAGHRRLLFQNQWLLVLGLRKEFICIVTWQKIRTIGPWWLCIWMVGRRGEGEG